MKENCLDVKWRGKKWEIVFYSSTSISTRRRWREGLVPQLVNRSKEEGRTGGGGVGEAGSGGRWVVLDGSLLPHQLETLLTLCDSDRLIKLSNGRNIPIDSGYRFILEVCVHCMHCGPYYQWQENFHDSMENFYLLKNLLQFVFTL